MKRKELTPEKELKDGNRLDTGRKKMNENAFIRNTMKRLSFDNKDTSVCFIVSSLDTRHYFNVYTLFFIRTSRMGPKACSP